MTHDEYRARVADGETHPDLDGHAASCLQCRHWATTLRAILDTAPTLAPDTDIALTARVLQRTTNHSRTRTWITVGAVAATALAVVAGGLLVTQNDKPTDQLAEIADRYERGEPFRFVYATQATAIIDAPTATDPADIDIVALNAVIPTCQTSTDPSPPSPGNGALDLAPLIDLLTSTDPCAALELIDAKVRPRTQETLLALSTARAAITEQLETLDATVSPSALERASTDELRARRVAELADLDGAIATVSGHYARVATALQPVAIAADQQLDTTRYVAPADTALTALQANLRNADTTVADIGAATVTWQQLSTGTWNNNTIDFTGTTEHNGTITTHTTTDNDPLGLANVLLADPQRLPAILDSAPATSDTIVTWTVPTDLTGDTNRWEATATIQDGELIELVLTSDNATITFTPQR